jgi:hypothetical protein
MLSQSDRLLVRHINSYYYPASSIIATIPVINMYS